VVSKLREIAVLDKLTIDKIAAGEVVERPSSVVKELVENAIDAGATAVTVEITDGGKKLIRVTDNGSGIEASQIRTAFLRHATSKIVKVEDLKTISSLGFRGEALSSIAAVSQVELITKTPTSLCGSRYVIEGGEEHSLEELGAPDGTTFLVRNLFYNTPARSKFLHSDMTEGNYISTLMEQLALSHPEISLKYIQNKQVKLHTSGNYQVRDVIYSIYGRDITRSLLEVHYENDFMKLEGYVGKPEISRGNRTFENYYINGRYIKNRIISKAIEDAYKGFLMQHKFPFVSLHLEMDGNDLDVNVHPSKMEVRFSRGTEVYDAVYQTVRGALTHREMIPQVPVGKEEKAAPVKTESKQRGAIPEPFETNRRTTASSLKENRPTSPTGETHAADQLRKNQLVSQLMDHQSASTLRENHLADQLHESGPALHSGMPSAPAGAKMQQSGSPVQPAASIGKTATSTTVQPASAMVKAADPDAQAISSITGNAEEPAMAVASEVDTNGSKSASSASAKINDVNAALQNDTPSPQPSMSDTSRTHAQSVSEFVRQKAEEELLPTSTPGLSLEEEDMFRGTLREREAQEAGPSEQLTLFQRELLSEEARREHKLIGQLFDTYWLVEFDDNFYIIDQHAAHEKVNYERFVKQFREQTITSQYVSPPIIVTLNLKEEAVLKANKEFFTGFGFEIEPFGGREYCISAVPSSLYGFTEADLFTEMLDRLSEDGKKDAMELFAARLATMACKASVKGGSRLSFKEADRLIDELLTLDNPYHCPHGRPTIISMTKYELEKKFHRIV
jgi:DNA mismatch repair protein MutL